MEVNRPEDGSGEKEEKTSIETAIYVLVPFSHPGCKHTFSCRHKDEKNQILEVCRDAGTIKKQIYRSDALGLNGGSVVACASKVTVFNKNLFRNTQKRKRILNCFQVVVHTTKNNKQLSFLPGGSLGWDLNQNDVEVFEKN